MGEKKDLTAIGLEILDSARSELYLNLPYLDAALCALSFESGEGKTLFTATDGEHLYYDGNYLAERFLRSRTLVNRIYLHSILHCMLRHLGKKRGKDPELWDLSCDIAVESRVQSAVGAKVPFTPNWWAKFESVQAPTAATTSMSFRSSARPPAEPMRMMFSTPYSLKSSQL